MYRFWAQHILKQFSVMCPSDISTCQNSFFGNYASFILSKDYYSFSFWLLAIIFLHSANFGTSKCLPFCPHFYFTRKPLTSDTDVFIKLLTTKWHFDQLSTLYVKCTIVSCALLLRQPSYLKIFLLFLILIILISSY